MLTPRATFDFYYNICYNNYIKQKGSRDSGVVYSGISKNWKKCKKLEMRLNKKVRNYYAPLSPFISNS